LNRAGASFVTYTFEASKILPVFYTWLKAQNDVTIHQRKIEKLDEKLAEFDYVINCCGIAARELVNLCRRTILQLAHSYYQGT
jgi:hypothetical protein